MREITAALQIEAAIQKLATKQMGLFAADDALSLGISNDSLLVRVRRGLLVREHFGVYRVAGIKKSFEQRCLAACLTLDSAALCGRTAAFLLGLPIGPKPSKPEVILPHGLKFRGDGIVARQTRYFPTTQPWFCGRITSAAATLVGIAGIGDQSTLARCLDYALANRLVTVDRVFEEIAARPTKRFKGSCALHTELDKRSDGRVRRRSGLERKVAGWLRNYGVEPARPNYLMATDEGEVEVDFAWPQYRVALR